jgi:hypothetical protein
VIEHSKTTHLIELESIEQFVQLAIFLGLLELDVVLLQSVQSQLRLVINKDFKWLQRCDELNN